MIIEWEISVRDAYVLNKVLVDAYHYLDYKPEFKEVIFRIHQTLMYDLYGKEGGVI